MDEIDAFKLEAYLEMREFLDQNDCSLKDGVYHLYQYIEPEEHQMRHLVEHTLLDSNNSAVVPSSVIAAVAQSLVIVAAVPSLIVVAATADIPSLVVADVPSLVVVVPSLVVVADVPSSVAAADNVYSSLVVEVVVVEWTI